MTGLPSLARLRAVLLLGAVGDALGYPIEFDKGVQIDERRGMPDSLLRGGRSPAFVSDDTQMTFFSVEGLVRWHVALREDAHVPMTPFLLGAYQRWYGTQRIVPPSTRPQTPLAKGKLFADARLHVRRAPGNTCLSALSRSFTRAPGTVDTPVNDSKGCGAVMRAAPFGLAGRTREEAFGTARDAGALTHGHASGYLSGAYLAAVVFGLVRDEPLTTAMKAADVLLVRERGAAETAAAVTRARELAAKGMPSRAVIEAYGGGWVGEEALAIGLACALAGTHAHARSTRETLWTAVAHDGDSDSTGSIAGNLLGAMAHGVGDAAGWAGEVEMVDLVDALSDDLYAAMSGGEVDEVAYPRVDGVNAPGR
jgi:ADP-ribosyl-[dinitrogen reductase] hydrolase